MLDPPAFGQVAADHSDATKAYDAVMMTESSGLDVAKHRGRRHVIQPHAPSSPSSGRRNRAPPPPKPRGGLAALAGGRGNQSGLRVRQHMHPPFKEGVECKFRRCCRLGTSIAM